MSSGVYLYADRYSGRLEQTLDQQRLLFYREGVTTTVAVLEDRYRFLRINGKTDGGDSPDNLTQKLLAHVPLLLHPNPRSVLVVGLGTGVTLGTALLHPIEHAEVVEISPEVVEASRFFAEANGRALQDSRTHLRILDARTWLLAGDARYDAIISEPSNPWQTGNATLFTRDHYRLTRRRLAAGGIFCQWLPFYRMDEADFKAAIRTFQSVFPYTTIWFTGDVLLVGGTDPFLVDPARMATRAAVPSLAQSLESIGIAGSSALLGFFLLDPERAREYAGDGPPFHTDNYPLLEFSAPKTLYREYAPQIISRLRQLAAQTALPLTQSEGTDLVGLYEAVAQQRLLLKMPHAAVVALEHAVRYGGDSAELRELQGIAWNEFGVVLVGQGDRHGAAAAFERALSFTPEDPVIHRNIGLLAFRGFKDLQRAERHLREAIRLHPGDRETLLPLAAVFAAGGRWADAEAAWRQVLLKDPNNPDARRGLEAAARMRAR